MTLSEPTIGPAEISGIDLLCPHLYATRDPQIIWSYLRRHAPVHHQSLPDGRAFWVVTRHSDVVRVLSDHGSFTSEKGTMLCILGSDDPAGGRMMAVTDPPNHSRLRDPLVRALSKRAIASLEPRARTAVRRLLAPAFSTPGWDIAKAMRLLPMLFIGELMGLPESDWQHLCKLTTTAVCNEDPEFSLGGPLLTFRYAHHELFEYFAGELAQRRRGKYGEDLISLLMSIDSEQGKLSDEAVIYNCYSLILGANVTTPHVVSSAVKVLCESPSEYQRWSTDPLLLVSGIEEALRWASPASHFMRYARNSVELNGQLIREGDAVSAWIGSANRDEEVFENVSKFDVSRRPNRHCAFGAGVHLCVGASLARMALRILFSEFFSAVERVELVDEAQPLVSNFVSGVKHMRVNLIPRFRL